MGVRNLHYLLKKKCPQVYHNIPLAKYAFKKIAIDVSIFMCKFRALHGARWLDGFLELITRLRQEDVHFVCVYDTKAPPEKNGERRSRNLIRQTNREFIIQLKQSLRQYQIENKLDDIAMLPSLDLESDDYELYTFLQRLVGSRKLDVCSFLDLQGQLDHLKHTLENVRSGDFETTKTLFQICGIPIEIADGEAESLCASLNKMNLVSAVLSDDTDVLVHQSPIMLTRLDMNTKTCTEIDYQEVLAALQLTPGQFVDLCIMLGTDYNRSAMKASTDKILSWIQQYKTIEAIETALSSSFDFSSLNHIRLRDIYKSPFAPLFVTSVPFCVKPMISDLEVFYRHHECQFPLDECIRACTTHQVNRTASWSESEDSPGLIRSTSSS